MPRETLGEEGEGMAEKASGEAKKKGKKMRNKAARGELAGAVY